MKIINLSIGLLIEIQENSKFLAKREYLVPGIKKNSIQNNIITITNKEKFIFQLEDIHYSIKNDVVFGELFDGSITMNVL